MHDSVVGDPRQAGPGEVSGDGLDIGPAEVAHRVVAAAEDARRAVADLLERGVVVGLDLETTGLDPLSDRPRLLQLAVPGEPVLVVDLFSAGGLANLADLLPRLTAVAHSATFDTSFLARAGVRLTPECTLLANHALTGKAEKLSVLAERHLGRPLDKAEQVSDWSGELSPEQLAYAAGDAAAVIALWAVLERRLAGEGGTRVYRLMRDAQPAAVAMGLAGMPFDRDAHATLLARLRTERERLHAALGEALAGRNPNSGQQLSDWLLWALGDAAGAWPKTGTGKALATGADALGRHAGLLPPDRARVVRELLAPFKIVEKRLSAFGENLAAHVHPATGRLHARYRLAGTVPGRMSCSRPNLQQVPRDREYRALFRAPEGRRLVIGDYGQAELRVAALLAPEPRLLAAFADRGADVHRLTAGALLGKPASEVTGDERQLAKAVNFGLLYGQGAKGLQAYAARTYGVEITEAEAGRHREAWFAAYPGFRAWRARTDRESRKALLVRTPAGRVRRWPTADRADPACWKLTEALNTPVQGGAAEAMLAALGRLPGALAGLDAALVAVVHDEVVLEAAEGDAAAAARALERCMVEGFLELFPDAPAAGLVEAHIGQSWAEK